METTNKGKYSGIIRGCLFAILVSLIIFAFGQHYVIYKTLEASNDTLVQAIGMQTSLTRTYSTLYHQTEDTLANVTKELDSTQALLTQTETMLNQAKVENDSLHQQVTALQENQQNENQMAKLMQESKKAQSELESIQSQLKSAENFSDVKEGKDLIALLRQKIRSVKNRIQELNRQAFLAKKAADEERDRIALQNGNQGFIVKDGQSYIPKTAAKSPANPSVKIKVSFYEN